VIMTKRELEILYATLDVELVSTMLKSVQYAANEERYIELRHHMVEIKEMMAKIEYELTLYKEEVNEE